MAESDAGSHVGGGERASPAARRRAARQTALVVDDEAPTRRFVAAVLRRHGFTVIEAADGRSAIRRVFDHHGRLDLLVTDFQMPELNGLEVAAMVSVARPETVVVMMTGDPTALAGAEASAPGPVLRKPFTTDELLAAVAQALAAAP